MEIGHKTISMLLERYYDHFSEFASEYGEPGYSCDGGVFLGNYWCRCEHGPEKEGEHRLHGMDYHYPRFFTALAEQGFELEWKDEWMVDYEFDKAYRTHGDSYSWTPSVVLTDDCEWLTPDSDVEEWIDWALNCPDRALLPRVVSTEAITEAGFTLFDGELANGWYPGQTDDPHKIAKRIESLSPFVEYVFFINGVGQFDMHFSVYVRNLDDEDEEE